MSHFQGNNQGIVLLFIQIKLLSNLYAFKIVKVLVYEVPHLIWYGEVNK